MMRLLRGAMPDATAMKKGLEPTAGALRAIGLTSSNPGLFIEDAPFYSQPSRMTEGYLPMFRLYSVVTFRATRALGAAAISRHLAQCSTCSSRNRSWLFAHDRFRSDPGSPISRPSGTTVEPNTASANRALLRAEAVARLRSGRRPQWLAIVLAARSRVLHELSRLRLLKLAPFPPAPTCPLSHNTPSPLHCACSSCSDSPSRAW
jgi:hypothetical protein